MTLKIIFSFQGSNTGDNRTNGSNTFILIEANAFIQFELLRLFIPISTGAYREIQCFLMQVVLS
jgi:hypothetical protein